MRISITTFLLLTFLNVTKICGQTTTEEFKPNGKPASLIFTNFNTAFSDGETTPAFEITRAYLGYEYNFSKEWFGRVTLDFGDPKVGSMQYTAFLKFAFIQYKKEKFKGLFGMIPTTQFKYSEDIWGLRYIEKSYMDTYDFYSSADLGFTIDYAFTKNVSADLSVFNGEGYKSLQRDEYLRPAIGVTVKEVKNFTVRIYADYMGKEVKQTTMAALAGYTGKKLVVTAEYNYLYNTKMVDGQDLYGTSIYVIFKPGDKIKYFARFDDLKSKIPEGESDPWQLASDGGLLMGGFEFGLIKGIKIAPNVRYWNPANKSMAATTYAYLNIELRY